MFVVEDLHWADRSTLDLVALLVRALRAGSVLVVVELQHRRAAPQPPAPAARHGLGARTHRAPASSSSASGATTSSASSRRSSARRRRRRLVDLVHERSEGNAFLVEEILGAVQSGADPDQLPLSLRDVLLARVERLSPAAQRLLRIAAAAGPSVSDRLLAAVAGLDDDELDDALREGARAPRARGRRDRGYVFRHALTRDAVYGDTLARERARIHAAYGEALSAEPALAGPRRQRAGAAGAALDGGARPAARARGLGRGRAPRRPLRPGRGAAAPRARPRDLAAGPRCGRAQRHRRRRGAAPRRVERVRRR